MKSTMMFKLDLKKLTLTAFRTPVQNGLMQKVNIFCTENEHLHAFNAPTKTRNKLDKGIMLIFVSEKNRPLLLAKGVCSGDDDKNIKCKAFIMLSIFYTVVIINSHSSFMKVRYGMFL